MITRLTSIITFALISIASAHPGPSGHTHPDEWPFEFLALGAGLGVLLLAFKLVVKNNSN